MEWSLENGSNAISIIISSSMSSSFFPSLLVWQVKPISREWIHWAINAHVFWTGVNGHRQLDWQKWHQYFYLFRTAVDSNDSIGQWEKYLKNSKRYDESHLSHPSQKYLENFIYVVTDRILCYIELITSCAWLFYRTHGFASLYNKKDCVCSWRWKILHILYCIL